MHILEFVEFKKKKKAPNIVTFVKSIDSGKLAKIRATNLQKGCGILST